MLFSDASGSPVGFAYRENSYSDNNYAFEYYWYEKNLEGDIVAIYDNSGNKVLSYVYDAWGNVTITEHGNVDDWLHLNPFTYRGYIYVKGFDMYYLGSRWYDPAIGRFISSDSVISGANGSLQGFNLYAYCFNNPVNMTDESGHWPEWFNSVTKWFEDTFGAAVVSVKTDSKKTGDWLVEKESGTFVKNNEVGDDSKPISVCVSYPKDDVSSVSDLTAGANLSFGEGGVGFEVSPINCSISITSHNTTNEFMIGFDKIGFTESRVISGEGGRTSGVFTSSYVKTPPLLMAVATIGMITFATASLIIVLAPGIP